jgi:hypothetical protein
VVERLGIQHKLLNKWKYKNQSKLHNMKNNKNDIAQGFLAFLLDYHENFKLEIKQELINEFDSKKLPVKLFYSLKETSFITGLSVRAIKERYRRGTLEVVYDGVTPLIPADSLNELLEKLNRQIMNKKRAA